MCGLHTATDTTKVYNYMKQDTLTASEQIKKIIQQVGEGTLTETIIRLFGDPDQFNLPKLDWQARFTDYGTLPGVVDNVTKDDMAASIMWGLNDSKCLFFALEIEEIDAEGQLIRTYVKTIFQAFAHDGNEWAIKHERFQTPGEEIHREIMPGQFDDAQFQIFKQLVNKEEVDQGEGVKIRLATNNK